MPETARPLPDDLRTGFIEAYWNSLVWRSSNWLGLPIQNPPTDLMIYQELLTKVRPDWIIETGASFRRSVPQSLSYRRIVPRVNLPPW